MYLQVLLSSDKKKGLSRGEKPVQRENRRKTNTEGEQRSTINAVTLVYDNGTVCKHRPVLLGSKQRSQDAGSSNHGDAVSDIGGIGRRGSTMRGGARGGRGRLRASSGRGWGSGTASSSARAAADLRFGGIQSSALG